MNVGKADALEEARRIVRACLARELSHRYDPPFPVSATPRPRPVASLTRDHVGTIIACVLWAGLVIGWFAWMQ